MCIEYPYATPTHAQLSRLNHLCDHLKDSFVENESFALFPIAQIGLHILYRACSRQFDMLRLFLSCLDLLDVFEALIRFRVVPV
jgi:hypothetical protein